MCSAVSKHTHQQKRKVGYRGRCLLSSFCYNLLHHEGFTSEKLSKSVVMGGSTSYHIVAILLLLGCGVGALHQWNDIRLPASISPLQYNLFLHLNLTDGQFQYSGNVEILLEVKEETDFIVLHSAQLKHIDTQLSEVGPTWRENVPIKGTVQI